MPMHACRVNFDFLSLHSYLSHESKWMNFIKTSASLQSWSIFYSVSLVQAEELEGPALEILSQCNLSR